METQFHQAHNDQVWPDALQFIATNYKPNPPSFRSGLHQFLNRRNKTDFETLQVALIRAIITSSKQLTNTTNTPAWNSSPAPFWWMLIHLDMLILALKPPDNYPAVSSITNRIRERINIFHMGQLKILWEDAMAVSSRVPSDRPPTSKKDDKAAQHAADHGN